MKKSKHLKLDDLIKQAVKEEVDNALDIMENSVSEYEFSAEFENKMQKLFDEAESKKKYKNTKRILRRVAMFVAIFLGATIVTVMNVEALRVPVLNFLKQIQRESMEVKIDYTGEAIHQSQGVVMPSYIPEGYAYNGMERYGDNYKIEYVNGSNDRIVFRKIPISLSMTLNNEDGTVEDIMVNLSPAVYVYRMGASQLVFNYMEEPYDILELSLIKSRLFE